MTRRIFVGAGAGLLSGFACLGVAYVVGVFVIAADVKEFFATLLAAVTVLPLMLLFVLLVPTLIVGLLTGVVISVAANYNARLYFIGAVAGLLLGLLLFSGVLPLIVVPQANDFTSIVTRPFWAGLYAFFLGLLAARFFRWFY